MNHEPYGIMAVDPGGSTGVAWATVTDRGTTVERLSSRRDSGSTTLDGDWRAQGAELMRIWVALRSSLRRQDVYDHYLVIEDFILTKFKSSDRTGLYPVWIAGCLIGHVDQFNRANDARANNPVMLQMPSMGASVTDDRLRNYGMWVKGRIHERSAMRHLAHFVTDEKSEKMRQARARTRERMHTRGGIN